MSSVLRMDGRKTVVLTESGRTCTACDQDKTWNEFSKDVHGFNQKTATCKSCRNLKHKEHYKNNPKVRRSGMKNRPDKLKRLYGVTYEHVIQTLANQFGRCANRACGQEISVNVPLGFGRAVIDHDHKTGKFRALLCPGCNSLLGSIETKQNIIIGLHEYLMKFK